MFEIEILYNIYRIFDEFYFIWYLKPSFSFKVFKFLVAKKNYHLVFGLTWFEICGILLQVHVDDGVCYVLRHTIGSFWQSILSFALGSVCAINLHVELQYFK